MARYFSIREDSELIRMFRENSYEIKYFVIVYATLLFSENQ